MQAVAQPTARPGPVAAAGWTCLPDALHAEWTKLRTLAGTWWLLLVAVALTVLVGAATAKALAAAHELPLAPVDHLHGHIAASFLEGASIEPPFVSLVASGWHTFLALVRDRGPGFDLDGVAQDRMGIRESILGRMKRHGGRATIRTGPGDGTEGRLEWRRG